MYFERPENLWFLLFLLIPLIIHFVQIRRPKKILFSSIQFIKQVEESTRKNRNLKNLLLLLSRLLFILFLVIVFALPRNWDDQMASSNFIFLIDNSWSMSNTSANGRTFFDEALMSVDAFAESVEMGTNLKLYLLDDKKFGQSWTDANGIRSVITDLSFGNTPSSFSSVLEKIEIAGLNAEIVFMSDFQKSTVGDINESIVLNSTNRLRLLAFQPNSPDNLYFDTVYFDQPVTFPESIVKVNFIISNEGGSTKNTNVRLISNGDLLASKSVMINPKSKTPDFFEIDLSRSEKGDLELGLDDFPLNFDNTFYLNAGRIEPLKITYIYEKSKNRNMINVFGNGNLFDFNEMGINMIDYEMVNRSELIILDGFENIPDFIKNIPETSTLLVIPSEEINQDNYKNSLGLDIKLNENSDRWPLRFETTRSNFFEGVFEGKLAQPDMPEAQIVYSVNSPSDVLLEDNFGSAFLSYHQMNRKIYFFSSPLKSQFTNFSLHGIFLPVMYRIAQKSKSEVGRLYYTFSNQTIAIGYDGQAITQLKMVGNARVFSPNFRVIGKEILVELPTAEMEPGHYQLLNEDEILATFAFNRDKSESVLDFYSKEELRALSRANQNISFIDTENEEILISLLSIKNDRSELWKYALVLALMFLIIEIMLTRLMK